MLLKIMGAVARVHRFPPPDDFPRWSSDALYAGVSELLTSTRAPERLAELAVKATSEESFERLLHRMVLNHLRSVARASTAGRLVRTMSDVLQDPRFRSHSGKGRVLGITLSLCRRLSKCTGATSPRSSRRPTRCVTYTPSGGDRMPLTAAHLAIGNPWRESAKQFFGRPTLP